MWWIYIGFMYENRIVKLVEIILRSGERIRENDGRGESKLYYKHICKCHMYPPMYNYYMLIENKRYHNI
jgi:hypothetical protein